MEDVRQALAVSVAARAISAVVGLLALPIYLRYLGVEAYGVVGFFGSLQVLVAFMDLGLGATLTRQLAGIAGNAAALPAGRDVTRTFELAYLAVAGVIALLLAAAAPIVASGWVRLNALSVEQVTWSLQLGGASLACGWPAGLYTAGLAGIHRQLPLAVSTCVFSLVRVALAVLFLSSVATLEAFFWSQVISSLLQSVGMRAQLWRELTLPGHRPRAQWSLLVRSRRFAGGMTAITITSILLSQMDKLILSHLLKLSDFGIYVVAGTLAAGLYIMISPVFSVIYPRISALWTAGDASGVVGLYHTSSQAMAVLVLPIAAVLVCFPAQSLFVLTEDSLLSAQGAWILVFLVMGASLNGIMNIPYALQLAAGWTSLSVWINAGALAVLGPAMWWAATRYGAAGGAAVWGFLNLGYLLLTPHLLHRRLLPSEKWRWYWQDVLVPGATSLCVALLLATLLAPVSLSRWGTALQLAGIWVITAFAALACVGRLRRLVVQMLWR